MPHFRYQQGMQAWLGLRTMLISLLAGLSKLLFNFFQPYPPDPWNLTNPVVKIAFFVGGIGHFVPAAGEKLPDQKLRWHRQPAHWWKMLWRKIACGNRSELQRICFHFSNHAHVISNAWQKACLCCSNWDRERERENMWKKNRLMSMDCNSQDNNPSPGQHKEETDMDGNEALPDIGGSVLSLGLVSGKEETLINLFHLDSNGQLIALVLTSVCRHCHFKAWSFGRVRRKLTMLEPWTIKLFVSGLPTRTLLWLYRCLPVHCITARYCQTAMAQACTNSRKCKKEWLPAFSDVPVFTPDNVRAWARLDMYSICSSQRMTTSGFRPLPSATFRTLAAS